MKGTRHTLERVPFDKADWKPHAKSKAMGALAQHVAILPGMGVPVLTATEFDVGGERSQATITSTAELLKLFDQNVAATRKTLAAADDAGFKAPWTLRAGDRVIFTLPRLAAWRTFVMSHGIHHRAQLGVYLRLNGIPVPGIYGPSADEPL